MTTDKRDTVSLLSQRCIDFLDLIAPHWQYLQLKRPTTAALEGLEALVSCNLLTLGDLSTVTPLMLLTLGAKVAGPPAEGAPFWAHLLQQERETIKPLLQTILTEQINTVLSQPENPTRHRPADRTIDTTGGETGYSSLLIQPEEVIDQWTNPNSITVVNWPYGIKRSVAFATGEICATPLLAGPVHKALRAAGYDLSAVPLSFLPLSVRTANACRRANVTTLETLTSQTPEQLMTLRNFGPRTLEEVLRAAHDYLLPWLEVVPKDALVPPEPLQPFVLDDTGTSQSGSVPELLLSPSNEQENKAQPIAEYDSGYSSLFIRIMKVLQQTLHPTAPTLSLYTPVGKGPAIHFSRGEVGNTPLLAKHIRDMLHDRGHDLNTVSLESIQLSPRARYLCERGGTTTLELLLRQTPNSLLAFPGLNHKYYQEIANTLLKYLTPWLRQFPIETLAPSVRMMPSLFDADDEAGAENDDLVAGNRNPLRSGKNALFFPIDAVIQAMGYGSVMDDDLPPPLAPEEISQNALLSERMIAALTKLGCNLERSGRILLFLENDAYPTALALRTSNALARASITTIVEIVRRSPAELMKAQNIGPVSYREVVERLHRYLQPWLDQLHINLSDEESLIAYQDPPPLEFDVLAEPEETTALSDVFAALISPDLLAWLDDYEVPWRQLSIAEACPTLGSDARLDFLGSLTLGDLAKLEPMTSLETLIAPELAEQAITEIQQTLVARLARQITEVAPSKQEQESNREVLMLVSVESSLAELLNQYILTKRKSEGQNKNNLPREMIVMLARSGVLLGQTKTLEELAATFHLTREGVRQLELRAEAALHKGAARPFMKGLTVLVEWAIRAEGGVTTVSGAAQRVATWLPFGSLDPVATIKLLVKWATDTTVKGDARLVASNAAPKLLDEIDDHLEQIFHTQPDSIPLERLIDTVMLAGGDTLLNAGRAFVAAAIRISDVIDLQGDFCLPRGKGSLRAQLVSVLRAMGRPAHFNEVAERYNAMYPEEKPRTGHTVQAIFLRFPETFARTGNGTYALAEAGYEGALTVADALERILHESGQPMHVSEIVAQGKEQYQWKDSALQAGLRTNTKIVSLGSGFFGLAAQSYPGFDAATAYVERFGVEPVTKERLVVATYTNQQHHQVVQLKLSENALQGNIRLSNKALREFFPVQGHFRASGFAPGQPALDLTIKRGQYDISGLARWFKHHNAQPGDFFFIEKLADEQAIEDNAFRLAYAPAGKLAEAMQLVGLSPTDEAGGAFDYRLLWRCREPEKLSALLTYMLGHPWPTTQAVNTALGFAPGSPHGADYVELGLLGGLLAIGKVEQDAPTEIVRPTPFGRTWIAEQRDADALAISLALSLPPYRAHLRSDFNDEHNDTEVEQMTTALLDPKLLAAWDARFGLAAPTLRDQALRGSNAVVTTARLPGPVLTLLLLLLAAQSNGLGISLPAAEANGLAHAQEAAVRLRQLGIAVQWDDAGQAALAEQVHLAVTSSASVEERLRGDNGPLGAALADGWRTIQQGAWPLHSVSAADLYTALIGTYSALFNSLLASTPEDIDQATRYLDGRCVPCPFVSLAADWGLVPTEGVPVPFAFLSHANRQLSGQTIEPIAICLSREVVKQDWDAKRALAANAHLALLTLIASDAGGLAERCSLGEHGHLLAGRPLIQALDDLLRGLGYTVWDEAYRQDAATQAALGRDLVALGERSGLLTITTNGFESLSPLATEVYYSAYDVLLRLQVLSSQLVNDHRLG
jgi:DNA-directed RNA polymerase alpha subunit